MTESKPSKSERKRRQLELQQLGESLIGLDTATLASLPLDDRLRDAVLDAAAMRSRGALRRQKQFIGKLMRDVDPDPIRLAIASLTADDAADRRLFARAEHWRDRILQDGKSAVAEFAAATGITDAQLRLWLSELEVCNDERREKTLKRQIFRRVHEILGNIPQ